MQASDALFSSSSLSGVSVVVLSGAFLPPSAEEETALLEFVSQGGGLAVMLHIGPPVARLIERLGVVVANGVIRESDGVLAGDPINFHVRHLTPHPVTRGLDGFAVYGGWALLPTGDGMAALGETGPHAWIDLNRSGRYDEGDAMQAFVVAAAGHYGEGRVAVFADDAMFQNQFLAGSTENRRLAKQLAAWLLERIPDGSLATGPPHRTDRPVHLAR